MYDDLRAFLRDVQEIDSVKQIEGADWDLEIGLVTELSLEKPDPPLLLFDKIKGYKAGYRVVANTVTTDRRTAMALGLPVDGRGIQLVKSWRQKTGREFRPVPPVETTQAPVKENVHLGQDIDLFEFPVPKWHELDGGRYIGTGDVVIQRDPDTGWVNLGTYRVQVMDRDTVTLSIVPGHHGAEIARKYWEKGLSCPVAIVCGQEPFLWTTACSGIPRGLSEYDYAGWVRNRPVRVTKGVTVDLPIPADAEIVLEGEFLPPEVDSRTEGPFGEWWGYYGGKPRLKPAVKVKAVLHRNDPIIMGAPPLLPVDHDYARSVINAAEIWGDLDRHFPGVRGVWLSSQARVGAMCIVSIEQQFPGHARHVATRVLSSVESQKWVIIVDDDIDPSDTSQLLWALGTRCEPENSFDILSNFRTMPANPMLPPDKRSRSDFSSSRAIIYACKPYSWIKDFPPSVNSRPELLDKVKEKWGGVLAED
ncbi:MAG: UbiD family decarboxylase [Chloroflexi bacterium]|nr:UbiD family decarboxylase [Chloroflexota bacterium]